MNDIFLSLFFFCSCQSNCYAGSGNIAVLALFNLELNIQVVTPGVQNDTLGYKWTLEMYDNSSNTYIDKSHVLVKGKSRKNPVFSNKKKYFAFDK